MTDRSPGSPVAPAAGEDYSHWFHAGNVGDVWKHCALLALLEAVRRQAGEGGVFYLETHSGQGSYQLAPTGEWTEGAGRLLARRQTDSPPPAVQRYLTRLEQLGFDPAAARGPCYPGSPLLALASLSGRDQVQLFELAEPAHRSLAGRLADEPRAQVCRGDGLAALPAALAAARATERCVMIDPPYTARGEWTQVPDALGAAVRVDPAARFLLWYPIKSLTRPQAMLARLQDAGVAATALDLITTPLELRRNRLNGSGLLLVNPPAGLTSELAAAAPFLGEVCATQQARWFMRGLGWGAGKPA